MQEHQDSMDQDWPENRKYVLAELAKLSQAQEKALDKLGHIETQLEGLKVRVSITAGLFGVVGGIITAVGSALVK